MIPRGSILSCLEGVGFGVAWRDRAFCDAIDAILVIRVELAHAMPMHACAIVLQIVVHSNFDEVAPVGFNGWSRNLSIDSESQFGSTIRGERDIRQG